MIAISLVTVGTLKEGYLREAIDEYKKRLSQYARVDEINIKEERIADEDNPALVKAALDAEGDKIIAAIPKDCRKVALCVEGKELSSEELAGAVARLSDECGRIAFIIGSSHGLAPKVKSAADLRLSFSRMTFPHQLMRVILVEALYRSMTIIAGKKYHK